MAFQGNTGSKSWLELALNEPLLKVEYRRIAEPNLYAVIFKQLELEQLDGIHLTFEMIYPFYMGMKDIIDAKKTWKTSFVKMVTTSREHRHVTYVCAFDPKQFSYDKMNEIITALEDQLTMKQNLNDRLLVQLSFLETKAFP